MYYRNPDHFDVERRLNTAGAEPGHKAPDAANAPSLVARTDLSPCFGYLLGPRYRPFGQLALAISTV